MQYNSFMFLGTTAYLLCGSSQRYVGSDRFSSAGSTPGSYGSWSNPGSPSSPSSSSLHFVPVGGRQSPFVHAAAGSSTDTSSLRRWHPAVTEEAKRTKWDRRPGERPGNLFPGLQLPASPYTSRSPSLSSPTQLLSAIYSRTASVRLSKTIISSKAEKKSHISPSRFPPAWREQRRALLLTWIFIYIYCRSVQEGSGRSDVLERSAHALRSSRNSMMGTSLSGVPGSKGPLSFYPTTPVYSRDEARIGRLAASAGGLTSGDAPGPALAFEMAPVPQARGVSTRSLVDRDRQDVAERRRDVAQKRQEIEAALVRDAS